MDNEKPDVEIVHKCEDAVKAHAKKRQGTRNDLTYGQNCPEVEDLSVKLSNGRATEELGEMAGVSRKTYEHAVEVLDKAPKPVLDAVRKNELSINSAYRVTQMPPEEQKEISKRIEAGEKPRTAVTDVKKENSHKNDKSQKKLTRLFTSSEIEQIEILAYAAKTDIDRMIVELVREGLRAEGNQRIIHKHRP